MDDVFISPSGREFRFPSYLPIAWKPAWRGFFDDLAQLGLTTEEWDALQLFMKDKTDVSIYLSRSLAFCLEHWLFGLWR